MLKKVTFPWFMGMIAGMIIPILGIFLVLNARPEILGIQGMDQDVVKVINTQIITLGMIINAALFFACLKFNKESASQGILFISVVYLVLIFVYRFLL